MHSVECCTRGGMTSTLGLAMQYPDENPFASPQSLELPSQQDTDDGGIASSTLAAAPKNQELSAAAGITWVVVFLLNLILPCLASWNMGHSGVGIFLAIVILLVGSTWLLVRKPNLAQPALVGGAITALTQFVPVLQLVVGLLCLAFVDFLFLGVKPIQDKPILLEFFYLLVTLLMGVVMLAIAGGLGWLLVFLARYATRRTPHL